MRLVCPNCVAQYEVADGTIPESGRDVQCANCHHVWFQDAAFKLSTDDLTAPPSAADDDDYDDEDADDAPEPAEAPGFFHSQRASKPAGDPTDAVERALPEVGGNVLDILRSEAAFSSRRRTATRTAPASAPAPAADKDPDRAEPVFHHKIGPGSDEVPSPEHRLAPAASVRAPDTEPDATDDDAETAPDTAPDTTAEKPALRDRYPAAATSSGAATAPEPPAFGMGAPAFTDWRKNLNADGPDQGPAAPPSPDWRRATPAFRKEPPMPDQGLVGLQADDIKRIADAAVSRKEPPVAPDAAPAPRPAATPEQDDEVKQAIRRVQVRSLASTPAGTDAAETAPRDDVRLRAEVPLSDTDTTPDALTDTDSDAETDTGAPDADKLDAIEAPDVQPAEADSGDEAAADAAPGPEDPATEAAPTLEDIQNEDDIRKVRRSLVENRKVLLPDVDELNTSLRMEGHAPGVDLRASAFSEEDAANRQKFWLGLVTALMLFGILSGLYLMAPAIADVFPAAAPYAAAFTALVDRSLDATATAWTPVVAWLEAL